MKKAVLLLLIATLLTLTACSAGGGSRNAYGTMPSAAQAAPEEAPEPALAPAGDAMLGEMYQTAADDAGGYWKEETGAGTGLVNTSVPGAEYQDDQLARTDPDRKLIRRTDMSFETTEFDKSVEDLEQMCWQFEGYVQDSSVTGASIAYGRQQMRSAYFTLRIPSSQYSSFLNAVGRVGNMIHKSQSSEDVTDTYYDTESRLKMLTMNRDRLFKLLEGATDSKSIIAFEQELSNVLYEIERMTGQLRKYDHLVDYSTVTVQLEEVVQYTEQEPAVAPPKGVGERIAAAFEDSAGVLGEFAVDLVVFVLGNILYILMLALVVALAVFIFARNARRIREANKARAAEINALRAAKTDSDNQPGQQSGQDEPNDTDNTGDTGE